MNNEYPHKSDGQNSDKQNPERHMPMPEGQNYVTHNPGRIYLSIHFEKVQ